MTQQEIETHITELLDAGAIVGADVSSADQADILDGRRYTHPALGDNCVVRLTPRKLAPGDDIEMEVLGFAEPTVDAAIGKRRRQSLGFPAWALIHDPKHARHALAVMKDLQKAARKARSKPGHANDDFIAIAKILDRTVPHFLPSYWEEVGRVFIEQSNRTYAARSFGKARDAEKVHALEIDENMRKESYIEFALAGSITIKAMTEYGVVLAKKQGDVAAWENIRDLVIKRTRGGLPPWPSMGTMLKKLAKTAQIDVVIAQKSVLAEIIDAPSLLQAPCTFWEEFHGHIKDIAADDADIARKLLHMKPGYFGWRWLSCLEKMNVLVHLDNPSMLDGGLVTWLNNFIDYAGGGWHSELIPRAFHELLFQHQDRIREDGRPLQLVLKGILIDLDLCERCFSSGTSRSINIPVSLDHVEWTSLSRWASRLEEDHEDYDKDYRVETLEFCAQNTYLHQALEASIEAHISDQDLATLAESHAVLAELQKTWLQQQVLKMNDTTVCVIEKIVTRLAQVPIEILNRNPESIEGLRALDLSHALLKSLRAGVTSEFTWQALGQAVSTFSKDAQDELTLCGVFPHAVVRSKSAAVVIDSNEIVLEHDFVLPKGSSVSDAVYLGSDLLVSVYDDNWDTSYYWVSNPTFTFESESHWYNADSCVLIQTAAGVSLGGQAFEPGVATDKFNIRRSFHDGETIYGQPENWQEGDYEVMDPRTGDLGRRALPLWLEEFKDDAWHVLLDDCELHVSHGSSLLARQGDLAGVRIRSRKQSASTEYQVERYDSASWSGTLNNPQEHPLQLVDWPGHAEPVIISTCNDGGNSMCTRAGLEFARHFQIGWDNPCHLLWWHNLSPCCLQSSKVLRNIEQERVADWLKIRTEELLDIDEDDDDPQHLNLPETLAAVRQHFPQAPTSFLAGIITAIHEAALSQRTLEKLISGDQGEDEESTSIDEETYPCSMLFGSRGWSSLLLWMNGCVLEPASAERALNNVHILSNFGKMVWPLLFSDDDKERETLADALDCLAEVDIRAMGPLYMVEGEAAEGWQPENAIVEKPSYCKVFVNINGQHFIGYNDTPYRASGSWKYLIQESPTILSGITDTHVTVLQFPWDAERCSLLAAAIREHGRPALNKEFIQECADGCGLSFAETSMLFCGCVGFDAWESNFLPKQLRTDLGLKVKEASVAKEGIENLPERIRSELYDTCDPMGLYNDAWVKDFTSYMSSIIGNRIIVPAELDSEISKNLQLNNNFTKLLNYCRMDPSPLTIDAKWSFAVVSGYREHVSLVVERGGFIEQDRSIEKGSAGESGTAEYFTVSYLRDALQTLLYCGEVCPVGDPVLAMLPKMYQMSRERLNSKDLLIEIVEINGWMKETVRQAAHDLVARMGAMKYQITGKEIAAQVYADQSFVVAVSGENIHIAVNPVSFTSHEKKNEALFFQVNDEIQDDNTYGNHYELSFVFDVDTYGGASVAKWWDDCNLEVGTWVYNPLKTAAQTLQDVAEKLSLDQDQSLCYLQHLALPRPTRNNILKWNDWKPAYYKKICASLCERKLLLHAKRKRAGREYFLPGGWEDFKTIHTPIESWKLSLYGIHRDAGGKVHMPLPVIVPLHTPTELFATAWQRFQDGDEPSYEEVQ